MNHYPKMTFDNKPIIRFALLLLLMSAALSDKTDEFNNGKLSSSQIYGGHKYKHILVEPKTEKSRSAPALASLTSGNRDDTSPFDWFTSSRGETCLLETS